MNNPSPDKKSGPSDIPQAPPIDQDQARQQLQNRMGRQTSFGRSQSPESSSYDHYDGASMLRSRLSKKFGIQVDDHRLGSVMKAKPMMVPSEGEINKMERRFYDTVGAVSADDKFNCYLYLMQWFVVNGTSDKVNIDKKILFPTGNITSIRDAWVPPEGMTLRASLRYELAQDAACIYTRSPEGKRTMIMMCARERIQTKHPEYAYDFVYPECISDISANEAYNISKIRNYKLSNSDRSEDTHVPEGSDRGDREPYFSSDYRD